MCSTRQVDILRKALLLCACVNSIIMRGVLMKKKLLCFLLVLRFASHILCACSSNKDAKNQTYDDTYYRVSEFYTEFLKTGMSDWGKAVEKFCAFPDQEQKTLALTGDPILYYEILRIEKLSDSLWVVETFTKVKMLPNGAYGVNYVGFVDGQYKVFLNQSNIPKALTEGVEIEPYEIHGPDVLHVG